MTTETPIDRDAERFPDPGKPEGGMKSWVDWALTVVFALVVLGSVVALLWVCTRPLTTDSKTADAHPYATDRYQNGVYIPAGNQLRFTPESDASQDASLTIETRDTCATTQMISVRVSGFTPGGEYVVRIKSGSTYSLDSGWTARASTTGQTDEIILNCRVLPLGYYTLEITDITTAKVVRLTLRSETRRL